MRVIPLIFFAFFLFLSPLLKAQDTLVKRNGEKLIVKLLEVNPNDLKYKRFDYQDGPVFTVSKAELSYIVYANGVKESYENFVAPVLPPMTLPKEDLTITISGRTSYYFKERRLEEQDMLMVIKKRNDPKLNMMVKKTSNLHFDQQVATYTGLAVFSAGLFTSAGIFSRFSSNPPARGRAGRAANAQMRQTGAYIMLGGVACELAAIYFHYAHVRQAHLAARQYNKVIAIL
jgi:hypothetical protein